MKLKNSVISFLFVLLVPAVASSAVEIGTIGIRAGASVSHMRHDSYRGSSESITGFIGGAFVNIAVSNKLIIQPSISYAQRGGVYHDLADMLWGGQARVDELVINRDYLELPVLFRYNFQANDSLWPSLVFGPVGSWVLTSELLEEGGPYPDESGGFDVSMQLGLGLVQQYSGIELSLDVSYRRAMTDSDTWGFKADGFDIILGVGF